MIYRYKRPCTTQKNFLHIFFSLYFKTYTSTPKNTHHERIKALTVQKSHLCISFNFILLLFSLCLSVALSLCLSVSLSLCRSVSLSLCRSVSPSLRRSVSPSLRLSVSPSLRLSVSPSLRLSLSFSLACLLNFSSYLFFSSLCCHSRRVSHVSLACSLGPAKHRTEFARLD